MKLNSFKLPVIIVLLLISIVQIIRLWFDDFSNRNFFYNVIERQPAFEEILDDDISILNPETMAVYYPENDEEQFYIIKNTRAEFEDLLHNNRRLIQDILRYGTNEGVSIVNWDDFWVRQSIVMKLPVAIQYEDLLLDTKITRGIPEENYYFDYIIIIPAANSNRDVYTYLVNSEQSQMMTISYGDREEDAHNRRVIQTMNDLFEKQAFPLYLSTKKLGLRRFSQNIFLPLEDINVNYNQSIQIEVPFIQNEVINEREVENYVNRFFSNPAAKYLIQDEHVWTYRDEQNIVRYDTNGIVEYTDLTVRKQIVDDSLMNAYAIGMNFIDDVANINNQEFYLMDYEMTNQDIILYFNYRYNDFDFVLSDSLKETLGVKAPLEIRISNDQVYYFKKWLIEKEISIFGYREFDIDYINALDRYVGLYGEDNDIIEDMYLAYYIDDINTQSNLNWIIKSDDYYIIELD
ncbi:hypothetical protein EDC19_1360 [Natranaerovirga hydrolytica]|uniref:Regulatory protein YycH of two-component signal transduction system YycFG n=1 Tax=Natranaerovirga hydrolytica TaxID=680378 RepID=A0A4R1MMQ2_9FIRM|nr:hypothetical protein [Natranaerovirga hydrolytica]TCK93172.1 hypothetical protein EDC19_1360 [Natranaerovirga hydrolytica]